MVIEQVAKSGGRVRCLKYPRSELGQLVFEDLVARGRGVASAGNWRSVVNKFLSVVGEAPAYERSDVVKFVLYLRSEGLKQSSIFSCVRALKGLYRVQGWPGGFPKLAMRGINADDVKRTIFSYEDVADLIRKVRSVGSEREKCFLCL